MTNANDISICIRLSIILDALCRCPASEVPALAAERDRLAAMLEE